MTGIQTRDELMDQNPTQNQQTVKVHRGEKRVFSEIALFVCTGSFRRAVVQCPGACHALYFFLNQI